MYCLLCLFASFVDWRPFQRVLFPWFQSLLGLPSVATRVLGIFARARYLDPVSLVNIFRRDFIHSSALESSVGPWSGKLLFKDVDGFAFRDKTVALKAVGGLAV